MKTLLVDPPFAKEEWARTQVRDLTDGPMGRRLSEYLALYAAAVAGQGEARLDELLERAGLPIASPETFTLPRLASALSQLATRGCAYGVDFLEQLVAVNRFVEYLEAHDQVRLDRTTKNWAERCQELALVTLVVCVNRHFGFIPDADGPGEG
jgi:hypothetical protein